MKKENVHEGHRKRMTEKVVKTPTSLDDHELLEYLLFSVVPRKNTNPLAHRLINVFGSIEEVFARSKEELLSVEGVGESVAAQIIAFGEVVNRIKARVKAEESLISWVSISQQRKRILSFFKGAREEKLVIVLLNKDRNEVKTLMFSNHDKNKVNVGAEEIREEICRLNAKYVIIMHNHPEGAAYPSEADDYAVMKFNVFCSANELTLLDSLIVGDEEIYSYRSEDRLEIIKSIVDIDALYEKFKKAIESKQHEWYI